MGEGWRKGWKKGWDKGSRDGGLGWAPRGCAGSPACTQGGGGMQGWTKGWKKRGVQRPRHKGEGEGGDEMDGGQGGAGHFISRASAAPAALAGRAEERVEKQMGRGGWRLGWEVGRSGWRLGCLREAPCGSHFSGAEAGQEGASVVKGAGQGWVQGPPFDAQLPPQRKQACPPPPHPHPHPPTLRLIIALARSVLPHPLALRPSCLPGAEG